MAAKLAVANEQQSWGLAPRTMEEAFKFADLLAKSDLVPKDYKGKPGNVIVAIQMGSELGLSPMQAIQNISVISGRPAVWGDAMLALVIAHRDCEDVQESDDGNTATCTVRRRGRKPVVRTFSMEDARQAGLANKDGPWRNYPKRMRQMRARAFALRDAFADVLRGLSMAEEAQDIPVSSRTTVVESVPHNAVQAAPQLPEQTAQAPAEEPPKPAEPFRFKTGEHQGELITEVPTEYLVRLGKHQLRANMRAVVDAEMERRNTGPYLAEQLQKSIDAQGGVDPMDVSEADPYGLAGDAFNKDGEPI